jgi:tRNA(fMet)-specific endonuclease VapC
MFDTNAISALVHHRAGWEQFARRIDGLSFQFLDFDELAAVHAGRIRAYLEPRGIKIGPMDTLLAAHALSIGATVVTGNMREFARVPGFAAENWLR